MTFALDTAPTPRDAPWVCPIPLRLVPSSDSESFLAMTAGTTALPLAPHPGAFAVNRKFHTHEGVDLYAEVGTPVVAVESGRVTTVAPFTGAHAGESVSCWEDTFAVWVEGASGVVLYGEIAPCVRVGQRLEAGQLLGHVLRVLKKDKGRPMSMLHLELHHRGSIEAPQWLVPEERPAVLRDPTPFLLASLRS